MVTKGIRTQALWIAKLPFYRWATLLHPSINVIYKQTGGGIVLAIQ